MPEIAQHYLSDIRYKLLNQGWRFDYEKGWVHAKHPNIGIVINEATINLYIEHEFKDMQEVNKFLASEKQQSLMK